MPTRRRKLFYKSPSVPQPTMGGPGSWVLPAWRKPAYNDDDTALTDGIGYVFEYGITQYGPYPYRYLIAGIDTLTATISGVLTGVPLFGVLRTRKTNGVESNPSPELTITL